jgi:hypothetical protein
MTIIPTHLSLTGILFWTFIPKTERENFKKKKWLFWVILGFSVFPDLDVFVSLHRGISHSLITPMVLIILGTTIYYFYFYIKSRVTNDEKKGENTEIIAKRAFFGRCLSYSGILWIIHLFLDLDYPLAIFFPLSDRLYQINFTYVLSLLPWLFFPAMIVGLGFKITGVSYLKGISTYFINLPPEVRKQIFGGTTATFFIDDFFIHSILFAVFLVYVTRPMLPKLELTYISKLKNINFDGPIFGLGIVFIIFGILIGPMIGLDTQDTTVLNGSFQVSQTVFSPALTITFEPTFYLLQPNTILHVKGNLSTSSDISLFKRTLLITTENDYENFSNNIGQLFKKHPFNTSINIGHFESNYSVLVEELHINSFARNFTNLDEIILDTNLVSGTYALIGLIENWNYSKVLKGEYLSEKVQLKAIVKTSRITVFAIGILSTFTGFIVLFFSFKVKK